MDDREIEITTKVKLSDLLKKQETKEVGGFPVAFAFVLIICCIFGLVIIGQNNQQAPSQNNTVIVK